VTLEPTVFPDADSLGAALAREIADGIADAGCAGRRYVLGCPGGRSPVSTYAALARVAAAERLDLSHVVIAMMDDYVSNGDGRFAAVPADAHYSVARFAAEQIAAPLSAAAGPGRGITPDRIWRPDPTDPERYDARLADAGGVDLFILASGDSDGHVAFNPPGSPAESRTRIITLAESTRRDNLKTFPEFASLDEVPRHGVSVGIATIATVSRRAVLVAPGASKRTAVARIAASGGYDPAWPATVLCVCRQPSLFVDSAAADPPPTVSARPPDEHSDPSPPPEAHQSLHPERIQRCRT
jgi:glucosamine-6-phosphate deaminase